MSLAFLIMICSLVSRYRTSVCTFLNIQKCTADLMAGKYRIAYCSQWIERSASCSSSLYITGDVAPAMFCSRPREALHPTLDFICSDLLYKWRIFCKTTPWRGRCCVVFASTRHGPRPSFSQFFDLAIILTAMTIHGFFHPPPHDQLSKVHVADL